MKKKKNISLFSIPENSKFYIETLGCPKNEVISEKFAYVLKKNKYIITNNVNETDYIIINSCGFIEKALEETIDTVLNIKNYFNTTIKHPKIILTGCAVELFERDFKKYLKEADIIFNYNDFTKYVLKTNYEQPGRFKFNNNSYAFLRISEGCSHKCTYCVIPKIKGPFKPFSNKLIFKEIDNLKNQNYKEIIIVSQDTLSFGVNNLKNIINYLEKLPFQWVRLMYFNPKVFTEEVYNLFEYNKVVKYVEIPIQHTENRILKLMGREDSFNKIKNIIYKFKEKFPDIILRTTVIVGFPQETEKEYLKMKEKLIKLPFDYIGVFQYSDMKSSASYNIKNKVSESEIVNRYNDLSETLHEKSNKTFKKFINQNYKFIVDTIDYKENRLIGRIYAQTPEIDGLTFIKPIKNLNNYKVGDFLNVKIEDNFFYDLFGVEI